MMRILLVGEFSQGALAHSYVKALKELDHEVTTFDCHGSWGVSNWLINKMLIKRAAQLRPELIFCIKAHNLYPRTLAYIKQTFGPTLINFYPDNPFAFWNGNSSENVLTSLPIYDCFLIWSKMLIDPLLSAGCKKVKYFPFALEESLFASEPDVSEQERKKYESDTCFVGTWEREREQWLGGLVEKMPTLNLAIWGNMWHENLSRNSLLRSKLRGVAIYGEEMLKAFGGSKIVLNFVRKQNMTSHNMRTFEVPAAGCFLLTQRTQEQACELFEEGRSIECFGTLEELESKVKKYLKNDLLRLSIAKAGKQRSSGYRLKAVMKEMIDELCG